jgi:hypothetical protein
VDAHTFTKQAENFKQTLSACQKADGNYFLEQETSADGGIHATRDHNNVRSGLLTSGVVLLHDNASRYAAASTQALLEHFNWELFDHSLRATTTCLST